ncbi:hypothetical protein PsYK624_088600 [Phanerochaete sordida]|uniref:Uncharacterized protein n=1 Tax=Phanerochaete sordida TaxID=48140 RepID=A0A9P3GFD5_9APHY|nr:hypothetical protein PsYK624_088600 [Phanerochaete sordida]
MERVSGARTLFNSCHDHDHCRRRRAHSRRGVLEGIAELASSGNEMRPRQQDTPSHIFRGVTRGKTGSKHALKSPRPATAHHNWRA